MGLARTGPSTRIEGIGEVGRSERPTIGGNEDESDAVVRFKGGGGVQ